jgi:hypothetical protein
MPEDRAIALVAPVIGLSLFAPWTIVSLFVGKTIRPHSLFGEIVARRTEPASYWFSVTVTGCLTAVCLFALIQALISN